MQPFPTLARILRDPRILARRDGVLAAVVELLGLDDKVVGMLARKRNLAHISPRVQR